MAAATVSAADEQLISALQQCLKGAGGFAPKKEILAIALALARDSSLVASTVCKQATPSIKSSGTRKRIVEYKERIINEKLLEKCAARLEDHLLPDLTVSPFGLSDQLLVHPEWIALHAPSLDELCVGPLELAGPLCAIRHFSAMRGERYISRSCPSCEVSLELMRNEPKEGECDEERLAEVEAAQQFWRVNDDGWLELSRTWVRCGSSLQDASLETTKHVDPLRTSLSMGWYNIDVCTCDYCISRHPDANSLPQRVATARTAAPPMHDPWMGPHPFYRAFYDAGALNRALNHARDGIMTPVVMAALREERAALGRFHLAHEVAHDTEMAEDATDWPSSIDAMVATKLVPKRCVQTAVDAAHIQWRSAYRAHEAAEEALEEALAAAREDYERDEASKCSTCYECEAHPIIPYRPYDGMFRSLLPDMCLHWHCAECNYMCCLKCAERARCIYSEDLEETEIVEYDLPPVCGESKEEQKKRRDRHRQREEACIRKLDGIAIEMYRRKRAQAARERLSQSVSRHSW